MRILTVQAANFGSFKTLAVNFAEETGLTVLEGPTGAGKSTLCDVVPWVLFGRTAKGGTVDEIRTWNSGEPTSGSVVLDLPDGRWEITRTRGKTNDLYYRRAGLQDLQRGKDLPDTQRLLNQKLGMDFDLYLAGAYYHEFSQTAQFFTTTAKNRRSICENLVDLSMAVKLQDQVREQRRELDQRILAAESDLRVAKSNLQLLQQKEEREKLRAGEWTAEREQRLIRCKRDFEAFEQNRTRKVDGKRCPTCKTVLGHSHEIRDDSKNPYGIRLVEIDSEQNPYHGEVKSYKNEIQTLVDHIRDTETIGSDYRSKLTDLDYLGLAADQYRSQSISNTIRFVEKQTNEFLTNFFDAELRVGFEASVGDKLEVTIFKDGNEASFTQLSKGQRQLLKFCFGVAVMIAVQNHHGISLNQLFFDEALDGLDDSKKLRALDMLSTMTLEYGSIWLVEHSEMVKGMATRKIHVELVNGESVLGETI